MVCQYRYEIRSVWIQVFSGLNAGRTGCISDGITKDRKGYTRKTQRWHQGYEGHEEEDAGGGSGRYYGDGREPSRGSATVGCDCGAGGLPASGAESDSSNPLMKNASPNNTKKPPP